MVETDPRLAQLLTRHFNDLQGLRLAAFAPVYTAAAWAWLLTGRELPILLGGGAAMILALALMQVFDRYYARFGRVRLPARHSLVSMSSGAIAVLLLRLQEHTTPGVPSVLWLLFSLYPLWLAADGWPLRWWHLGTFASMVYVAFGRAAEPNPTAFAWMAARMWAFSGAMFVTGIADHFLLLRTLRMTRGTVEAPAS